MNKAVKQLSVLFVAGLTLACSFSSFGIPALLPATDTPLPVAADTAISLPTEAPASTPTAPPAASPTSASYGINVSYDNLHFWIPDGLSTGTNSATDRTVELPFVNPSNGDMPEHTRVVLEGYPIQGAAIAPQIHLFKASDYAGYTALTQQIITTLQTTQFLDGQPLPEGLPAGPFSAHVGSMAFANGHGIRYLTQFDQGPVPINNQELIYYFQGLTTDGAFYVQVTLPVTAPFLAADGKPDTPLPTDGVPFNMDQLSDYLRLISDRLNATPPGQFVPPLPTLDALVQSISIK